MTAQRTSSGRSLFAPAGALNPNLNLRRPVPGAQNPASMASPPPEQVTPPPGQSSGIPIVQQDILACVGNLSTFIRTNRALHPDWFVSSPLRNASSALLTASGRNAFTQAFPSCIAWVQSGMPDAPTEEPATMPPPAPPPTAPPTPTTIVPVTPTGPTAIASATPPNAIVAYWQSMPLAARYTVIGITGALVGIGIVKIVDRMSKSEAKSESTSESKSESKKTTKRE